MDAVSTPLDTRPPLRRRRPPVPAPAHPVEDVLPDHPQAAPPTDADQAFVAGLRAAAAAFAAAAGVPAAMVLEAVPPARHRRARCRLALRVAGGLDEVAFLGAAGRAGGHEAFAGAIARWLAAGRPLAAAWTAGDGTATGGTVVDLVAWGG